MRLDMPPFRGLPRSASTVLRSPGRNSVRRRRSLVDPRTADARPDLERAVRSGPDRGRRVLLQSSRRFRSLFATERRSIAASPWIEETGEDYSEASDRVKPRNLFDPGIGSSSWLFGVDSPIKG